MMKICHFFLNFRSNVRNGRYFGSSPNKPLGFDHIGRARSNCAMQAVSKALFVKIICLYLYECSSNF